MKRSKIFLGLTTACLAIAGVVAARATHFVKSNGYYTTAGNKGCIQVITPCLLDRNSSIVCVTTDQQVAYYTARTVLAGAPAGSSKCVHSRPLTYTAL